MPKNIKLSFHEYELLAFSQTAVNRARSEAELAARVMQREDTNYQAIVSMFALRSGMSAGEEFGRTELKQDGKGGFTLELHPKPVSVAEIIDNQKAKGA